MRRLSVTSIGVMLALSTILIGAPAMADTSTVSWDFAGGFPLTPGAEIDIASLTVPDPEGSDCVADLVAINQRSIHPGNNLNVYLNGALLMSIPGFEDDPFVTLTATAGFVATGSDELVVAIESTRSRITSAEGSLTVTCEPPPDGGEGCTPGYWKQEHHFDSWTAYMPHDSFDVVFGVDSSFATLLDGVSATGGGENAMARHAVAALLNATSPDVSYEYAEVEVIALVQYAYATGHFEYVKNLLVYENEMGCPLN